MGPSIQSTIPQHGTVRGVGVAVHVLPVGPTKIQPGQHPFTLHVLRAGNELASKLDVRWLPIQISEQRAVF
jgi:hypothetical protein